MNRLVSILLLIFTVGVLNAQEVSFTASAPRVVEEGEQFRLTYSLNEKGSDIKLGNTKGFQVAMGPSVSQSFSTQIINGKMTSQTDYSFTYVLIAEKEGVYEISPATVKVDGKEIKSNSIKIEVVKASEKPADTSGRNNADRGRQQTVKINKENLFVRVELDKKSVYIGEKIVASLKIYSRGVNISNLGRAKIPQFDGFLTQEIELPQQVTLQRENYNGTIYQVGTLRKLVLFPQHTGEITIDPFVLDVYVRQRMSAGGGFFDDFFDNYREMKVNRRSNPIKVHVKELPTAGKPAYFRGTVGNFRMNSSINRDSVMANDAVTVKVNISGTGNLKLIEPLNIKFPADFEVYDPKTSQNIRSGVSGTSGTVSFEYVVIPRSAGDYTIPSASFSYFDLSSKTYKTLHTKEFVLHVKKGKQTIGQGNVVASFSKEDVKYIGKDIRYIKTGDLALRDTGKYFFGSVGFISYYIVSLLLFVMAVILNRRRIKNNSDAARVKNKRATKMAKKRLKLAEEGMKQGKKEIFYQEILKALWGYTSDKLNIPLSKLSKDNIEEVLRERQVDDSDIADYTAILNECEFAQYAPVGGKEEMGDMYKKTTEVILNLEKNIK